MTTLDVELGKPNFLFITYDDTSATNDPVFYHGLDGTLTKQIVGSGLTESSPPVGNPVTDVDTAALIGEGPVGANTFDGNILEMSTFGSSLSEEEIRALWESTRHKYESLS